MAKTPNNSTENNVPSPNPNDDPLHEEDEAASRANPATNPAPDRGNPPWTTKGPITTPKFGSAGSGGAEIEPGLKRD